MQAIIIQRFINSKTMACAMAIIIKESRSTKLAAFTLLGLIKFDAISL